MLCEECVVLRCLAVFFVFKQKTAYEVRISDWSSDVCSSDLNLTGKIIPHENRGVGVPVVGPPRPISCANSSLGRGMGVRYVRRTQGGSLRLDRKSVV